MGLNIFAAQWTLARDPLSDSTAHLQIQRETRKSGDIHNTERG